MKGYRRQKRTKKKDNSRTETFIAATVCMFLFGGIVCWLSFAFTHHETLDEKLTETRNLSAQEDSVLRKQTI